MGRIRGSIHGEPAMFKASLAAAIVFVATAFSSSLYAQKAQTAQNAQTTTRRNPYVGAPVDGWTGQPVPQPAMPAGPAPRHDVFGIWDPGNGGIQAMGAGAMPEDG